MDEINFGLTFAALIAWFNLNGYKLSSELLSYAKSNKKLNSNYTPKNGYLIKYTNTIKKIANRTSTKGSSSFRNSRSKEEKDSYYGIRKFNYTKPSKKSKTVSISDRYDFSYEGIDSIQKVAIMAMYSAQRNGYLTPFYTKITVNV